MALPSGSDVVFGPGTVAWADDVPVIKVTAKKRKALTPEDCRERGLSIRECVHGLQAAGWGYPAALFAAEDAYTRDAVDAAREACQKAKQSVAGQFGLAAGSIAVMAAACSRLPNALAVTACNAAVGGAAAVCGAVDDD